jgi:hypothetical protein
MKQNSNLIITTTVLLALGAIQSEAQTIFNTPSGVTPVAAGLNDSVYHNVPGASSGNTSPSAPINLAGSPSTLDIMNVEAYAAATAPSYTFLNSNTGFNYANASTTAEYLGSDAAGAAATDSAGYQQTVFDALGYINVSLADVDQTYTFTVSQADDAGVVFIGGNGTPGSGTLIAEQNYQGRLAPSTGAVEFTQAGLYPIEVMTYQGGGGSDLTLDTSVSGSGTSVVYDVSTVPEPSTWALGGLGLAGLMVLRRGRADRCRG